MPTPVSAARQCLTTDAAQALDEAVAVARRRSHAQTTSLHAVTALLSLPSSPLRDACARARNSTYSPRLQFKALELCLGVSLDRVSSSGASAEPPVSNSLMAAIKRSQANQRRQPENYHLYHQNIANQSTISSVKVELQHLILSILDDPVVSRVFGEAGFRSSEIKMAILRPFSQLLKYSRYRGPPVFLCNLPEYPTRNTGFGFAGFFGGGDDVDGNSRRIGEVLGRSKGRNPLLVGVCAYDALKSFADSIEKRNDAVLPPELSGLTLISVENDVASNNGGLFREVSRSIERCFGPGLVVNIGDLKPFISGDGDGDPLVGEMTRLLEVYSGKVWLIGATESYESYQKFVSKFPAVEKDWDLQLFPITSLRPSPSSSSMAEPYPRSSLMESFVPFGGFFSAPSDLKFPVINGSNIQSIASLQCNDKSEQQVADISKGGGEQSQSSLPSWLQMAALRPNRGLLDVKTKDDGELLNTNTAPHSESRSPFPTIFGFQSSEPEMGFADKPKTVDTDVFSDETTIGVDLNSCILTTEIEIENVAGSQETKNQNFPPKDEEQRVSSAPRSPYRSVSNSSVSGSSVTTDLGLGLISCASDCNKPAKSRSQDHIEILARPSPPHSPETSDVFFDPRDVKMLFKALLERVSWQWEAISVISQAVVRCRHRTREKCHGLNQRRDIWLSFIGPDRFGKRKIAIALAELLYGKRESFISVDLSFQNRATRSESNGFDFKFRGKNVVDHIAAELSKKPLSVVFLENVDKSDVLVRRSLSRAISTGKFSDSYGREVSASNTTFVTTSSTFAKDHCVPTHPEGLSNYSEERISKTRGRPLRISIEYAARDSGVSSPIFVNKRKSLRESPERLSCSEIAKRSHKKLSGHLDLNLPAEDIEGSLDLEPASESSEAWLQEFLDQVDETAVFKPVDFDAVAERIYKRVKDSFLETVHSKGSLEIESKVMEQFLAAVYLSDKPKVVEDWVDQVLSKGFEETQKRHSLSAHSIVKLVACEGMSLEDQAQAFCLPPRIILN